MDLVALIHFPSHPNKLQSACIQHSNKHLIMGNPIFQEKSEKKRSYDYLLASAAAGSHRSSGRISSFGQSSAARNHFLSSLLSDPNEFPIPSVDPNSNSNSLLTRVNEESTDAPISPVTDHSSTRSPSMHPLRYLLEEEVAVEARRLSRSAGSSSQSPRSTLRSRRTLLELMDEFEEDDEECDYRDPRASHVAPQSRRRAIGDSVMLSSFQPRITVNPRLTAEEDHDSRPPRLDDMSPEELRLARWSARSLTELERLIDSHLGRGGRRMARPESPIPPADSPTNPPDAPVSPQSSTSSRSELFQNSFYRWQIARRLGSSMPPPSPFRSRQRMSIGSSDSNNSATTLGSRVSLFQSRIPRPRTAGPNRVGSPSTGTVTSRYFPASPDTPPPMDQDL